MSIPGSNLLLEALDMIESQPVQYFQNTGRTLNAAGVYVATLAPGVAVNVGSVQAVPENKFQVLGLDYAKNYVYWFVPRALVAVDRNMSGDQMAYAGKTYQIESTTEWNAQDGWVAALCVQIAPG